MQWCIERRILESSNISGKLAAEFIVQELATTAKPYEVSIVVIIIIIIVIFIIIIIIIIIKIHKMLFSVFSCRVGTFKTANTVSSFPVF